MHFLWKFDDSGKYWKYLLVTPEYILVFFYQRYHDIIIRYEICQTEIGYRVNVAL